MSQQIHLSACVCRHRGEEDARRQGAWSIIIVSTKFMTELRKSHGPVRKIPVSALHSTFRRLFCLSTPSPPPHAGMALSSCELASRVDTSGRSSESATVWWDIRTETPCPYSWLCFQGILIRGKERLWWPSTYDGYSSRISHSFGRPVAFRISMPRRNRKSSIMRIHRGDRLCRRRRS